MLRGSHSLYELKSEEPVCQRPLLRNHSYSMSLDPKHNLPADVGYTYVLCFTIILSLALMQWQKIYTTISPGKNLAHLGSNSKQMNLRCQSFISRLRPYISSAVESSVLFPFAKISLKWTSPVDLHNLQNTKPHQPSLCKFFSASEDISHSMWPAKNEPSSRITRFVYW